MPPFTLHPRLESDSLLIRDLPLSQLRLQNQKNVPWLLLVPRRAEAREIFDLTAEDRAVLMDEITQTARVLTDLYSPDKINIGALGNIVPQLHIHVIARFSTDPAWPASIWGAVQPAPYSVHSLPEIKAKLNDSKLWP